MKKSILILLIVFFVLIIGSFFINSTFAQTVTSTDTEALIIKLQEQVKALQEQVTKLQAEVSSTKTELEAVKTELKFTKALSRGATGDEVKQLQEFLKQFPDVYPQGLVSGYFGSLTEAAVKKFQEKQGIESVGIVGPKTLSKLNELVTEGAGTSSVIPPGLLITPGIQKKLETPATTTTSVATPTAPTPTQSATIAPTGVCLIKDRYTDIPRFNIADFGNGFGKYAVSGVNTVSGLKTSCTKTIYDYILQNYCKSNGTSAQRLVMTYGADGIGNTNNLSCGALGCDFIDCSSITSLATIATPTTTPSGTVPAVPATSAQPISVTGTSTVPAISATPAQPVATATSTTTPAADTLGPWITNLSISPTSGPPGTIITFTVTAEDPAGIGSIVLDIRYPTLPQGTTYYLRPNWNFLGAQSGTQTFSQSVDYAISPTLYGNYVIESLRAADLLGNVSTYYPNGTVSNGKQSTHSLTIPSITIIAAVSQAPNNSALTVQWVSSATYNTQYSFTVSDPDGIKEFKVASGLSNYTLASGYTSGSILETFASGINTFATYPACSTSVNKTVSLTITSDLPLTGYVIDCVNAGTKYTIQGSASPPPSNTATSTSFLNPRAKNLAAISQMLNSLSGILEKLSQLLK